MQSRVITSSVVVESVLLVYIEVVMSVLGFLFSHSSSSSST